MARQQEFSRDQALHSAMLLFWEKGFERTNIEALTQATNLSRSSLYNTFGSKEELFMESLDHYASIKGEARQRLLEASSVPSKEMIRLLFGQLIDQLHEESIPDGCLLTETVGTITEVNAKIRRFIQDRLAEIYQIYLELIKQGQATGEIAHNAPADELGYLLLNLHESIIVLASIEEDEAKQKHMIDALLDMF